MADMKEMVAAHLANVAREIVQLNEKKQIIDAEIVKLQQYLTEGKQTLEAQENSNVENPIPQSQTFLGDSYGK